MRARECITAQQKRELSSECKWKITRGWNDTQKRVNEGKYLRKALNTFPLTYNIFYIETTVLSHFVLPTSAVSDENGMENSCKPSTAHVFILAAWLSLFSPSHPHHLIVCDFQDEITRSIVWSSTEARCCMYIHTDITAHTSNFFSTRKFFLLKKIWYACLTRTSQIKKVLYNGERMEERMQKLDKRANTQLFRVSEWVPRINLFSVWICLVYSAEKRYPWQIVIVYFRLRDEFRSRCDYEWY